MSGVMPLTRAVGRLLVLPLAICLLLGIAPARAVGPTVFPTTEFPPGYEAYHTYAEMEAVLDQAVADHPDIVAKLSIGRSYEGRELWTAKISDNVAVDEDEPEALFDSLIHGREHLTVEMNLYLLELLTDGYGSDERITHIVDSREIWLVFMLNPDGGEHDIAGDEFVFWRKNRQPIPGSSQLGIDPNRNFGFKWGCCEGSSAKPKDETYRGWTPWAAPEVRAYRDFIRSRVVDGRQQIRVAISWHSSGELIMWPYGYTDDPDVRTMTSDDRLAFVAMAAAMSALNGYNGQPSNRLYAVDGDQASWSHYEHRIFHFTFEMFPAEVEFYPGPEHIAPQTARNRDAVLYLLEQADCPYRAAGLGVTHCGALSDDLEIHRGWQIDPYAADSATGGSFERAAPRATRDAGGVKQRARVPSGEVAFVTDASGGTAGLHDLDGGVTSVASPALRLSAGGAWQVAFRYSFAHDRRSTRFDFLRLSVVGGDGQRTLIWSRNGLARNVNAEWRSATVSLEAFAGSDVRLLFEAADGGRPSLVEAAFDDVRVYAAGETAFAPPSASARAVGLGAYAA
jgi:carboxypeptidase T